MSFIEECIAVQKREGIEPGLYQEPTGRRGYCKVIPNCVTIDYEDGGYSAMNFETFRKWGFVKESRKLALSVEIDAYSTSEWLSGSTGTEQGQ